jgi:hypothetical protein
MTSFNGLRDPETNRVYSIEQMASKLGYPKDQPMDYEILKPLLEEKGVLIPELLDTYSFIFPVSLFYPFNEEDRGKKGMTYRFIPDHPKAHEYPTQEQQNSLLNAFAFTRWLTSDYGGDSTLNTPQYNVLLELEPYFQTINPDFKLWEGDKINGKGIKSLYEDAFKTFMDLVGTPYINSPE